MRTLKPQFILGVTGVIVLLILLSLAQEMNRKWQIEREVQRLEQDARAIHNQVIELENLNQYFRTDDYQERLAREKLNYRAPGEEVVLIPEKELEREALPTAAEKEQAPSIPMRWWRVFFVDEPVNNVT